MELRECPFCGGEAIGFEWSDDEEIEEGEPHMYDAYCAVKVNHKDNCVLKVGEFYCWVAPSEEEAAVLWNRRAERTCRVEEDTKRASQTQLIVTKSCSECGHCFGAETHYERIFEGMVLNEIELPSYCSNCGAKVMER